MGLSNCQQCYKDISDLSDAWTTCVGQHCGASFLEKFSNLVSLDRCPDLFRAWCAEEGDLETSSESFNDSEIVSFETCIFSPTSFACWARFATRVCQEVNGAPVHWTSPNYHVFIRAIRAGANETNGQFIAPSVLFNERGEFGNRGGQVRRERAVDRRFYFGKILTSR